MSKIDEIFKEMMDSDDKIITIKEKKSEQYIPDDRGGWDGLHDDMINAHADRINHILHNTADDNEFITIYFKILEFFVPKITRETKKGKTTSNAIELKINKTNIIKDVNI